MEWTEHRQQAGSRQLSWLMALVLAGLAGCAAEGAPGKGADAAGSDAPAGSDAGGGGAVDAGTDVAADSAADSTPPGSPLSFCAPAGKALVRELKAGEALVGPAALGGPGDWVLANDRAAFVIQKPGGNHTYYYYGGLPIDAAPLRRQGPDCVQDGPETFGEMALAVGMLKPAEFLQSILRGFSGEKAEVLADGADGKAAILRVWGSDQPFWLVEMELILRTLAAGGYKARSQPLGLKLAIDYVLPPGGAAMEIRLHLFNQKPAANEVITGAAVFPDDSTVPQVYYGAKLDLGGFGLQASVPWFAALGPSSWALGVQADNLARVSISGVDALLDVGQLGQGLQLGPAGDATSTTQRSWWLAVAAGGTDKAIAALQEALPEASRIKVSPLTATVSEQVGGYPVSGALATVERKNSAGWLPVASAPVVAGQVEVQVPAAALGEPQRLQVSKPGWPLPPPVDLPAAGPMPSPAVLLAPTGRVSYQVVDSAGKPLPAKLFFYAKGELIRREYTAGGSGELSLAPGDYEVTVARGYEYTPYDAKLKVEAQATTSMDVKLAQAFDTSGFMSLDGHVHAAPSADSTVPMATRFVTAAAEGLEVVMHTDHEIITDPAPHLLASGVQAWVASVPGEELTASSPEHINLWGTPPDPTSVRGNPVQWYGKDLAQLYKDGRQRGAQVVTLNHPRQANSCNYLCLVDWDRVAGAPKLTDPTALGLSKDATLWSWDFDAVELMNGLNNPFAVGVDPRKNGIFDDWMSFLNHGHRIIGVGVTDVHEYGGVGTPRTYFGAPTDLPTQFKMTMVTDAIKAGNLLVSAGAFARVTLNGKGLGATATASEGKADLQVEVVGLAGIDVQRIVVLANCDEVASVAATDPGGTTKFKGTISLKLSKDSHLVVMAFGKSPLPRSFDSADAARIPRFITNPIYADVNGDGSWTAPGGKTCAYTVGP